MVTKQFVTNPSKKSKLELYPWFFRNFLSIQRHPWSKIAISAIKKLNLHKTKEGEKNGTWRMEFSDGPIRTPWISKQHSSTLRSISNFGRRWKSQTMKCARKMWIRIWYIPGKKAPTYRAFVRVLYSIVVLNLFIFNAQHSLSPNPWMPGKVNQPHLQCLIPIKTLIETLHLCLSWPLSCYIFYRMSIIKKKNILHNELIINEHATNLYILLKINIYPFKNENFID